MIEDQLAELEARATSFARAAAALPNDAFFAPLGRWTPRDIVAHLIGWNRHVIRGSRQILEGQLPFYDEDPGEDFANVNQALIRTYPSRNRNELLAELRDSKDELAAFLHSIDADVWDRDFGVKNHGEVLTIKSTVDDLIADYAHHENQLDRRRA